ncbi:dephospho-CoA kinase [Rickettsia endosymbiont of Cardiosporidium cionae]|uniref:dephospho-CoA kinase n=1 Tax=Rickettsia endosymbiont of Cardiosporidium cionae TaxID=2777155 RepID=UPI001893AC64|nr:dephospho-CoA kinase [Rickettsia endosymbiont of Cardiosporidium cionae]KAF8818847.1 dephospho-CoA kinase [Rickettsia endosymbiont of Cardiosporidium cionae]
MNFKKKYRHSLVSVAITGSLAVGKSYLLNIIDDDFGCPVFSSDLYVKKLYQDARIRNSVLKILNITKFSEQEIANIIYTNRIKRIKLEEFIHPMVLKAIFDFKNNNHSRNLAFFEIPLLFEAKFQKYFDYSILVYCSEKSRIRRAEERGFNLFIFNQLKKIQFSQLKKKRLADFMICSDINRENQKILLDKIITKIQNKSFNRDI